MVELIYLCFHILLFVLYTGINWVGEPGLENIWLSVMTHGPRCAKIRTSWPWANIFRPASLLSQLIHIITLRVDENIQGPRSSVIINKLISSKISVFSCSFSLIHISSFRFHWLFSPRASFSSAIFTILLRQTCQFGFDTLSSIGWHNYSVLKSLALENRTYKN